MIRLRIRSPGQPARHPLGSLSACLLALAAALPAPAGADEVDALVRRMLDAQASGASTRRNPTTSGTAANSSPERERRPASAADMADQCAWAEGDELVLKLGKDCPTQQVAATVRQAVQRHAASVSRTNCGPVDQCRERRAFEKLQRYSSLEFERKQAGAPRYYGQK